MQESRKYLTNEFEIMDLGSLKYFMGIETAKLHMVYSFLIEIMFLIFLRKHECLDVRALIIQ